MMASWRGPCCGQDRWAGEWAVHNMCFLVHLMDSKVHAAVNIADHTNNYPEGFSDNGSLLCLYS